MLKHMNNEILLWSNEIYKVLSDAVNSTMPVSSPVHRWEVIPQYIKANTVLSSGDCYVIGFLPNHAQSLAYTVPIPPPLNATAN